jgi:phosphate acetyltransferase
MKTSIFILPTSKYTGLRVLTKSIEYALQQEGLKVTTFHPIYDMDLSIDVIEKYLLNNRIKDFVEILLSKYYEKCLDKDFVVFSGLFRQGDNSHPLYALNGIVDEFNIEIIKALSAKIIIVSYHGNKSLAELNEELEYSRRSLPKKTDVLGAIITKVNATYDEDGHLSFSLTDEEVDTEHQKNISISDLENLKVFKHKGFELLGAVEWTNEKTYPRVLDIKNKLKLDELTNIDLSSRVQRVMMCSRGVDNFIKDLTPNSLVITSADRSDILLAVCLAAKNGMKIAGIILTAKEYLNNEIKKLCLETAEETGVAILATKSRSVSTILRIANIDVMGIPLDDKERIQAVKDVVIDSLDKAKIIKAVSQNLSKQQIMSPPAFRYHLLKMARQAKKRIILPESYEPRTLLAAKHCQEQGLAQCVLLGDKEKINKVAELNGFTLPEDIEIINLDEKAFDRYVDKLIELRKHKGLSESLARDALKKPIMLATLMLQLGEVDGLVSGAEHTTADVLRPALQLVKTKPNASLVSSVFFMCMPDEVIVFADCAVNQDPTAEQLVDIAIQSAESAKKFNIEPRIAMISYSTGTSGSGAQVDKVRNATELLKQKAPELLVDGPLQYDAAMIESVAKQKAPNSPVAGKATVLIFPDLNTGNTVYKAVQRSANVLSIGPVLQGINKPVNDLSRGATVDDITYTIAITAIQAI